MEQVVQKRDAGGDPITMLQQSALHAQSSGTLVPQPDEFDSNDDKWPGSWFGGREYAPEDGESERVRLVGET